MFLAFGILYYFFLVDLSSVSAGRIVLNQESNHKTTHAPEHDDDDIKSDPLKNNADHPVLKHLHQIYKTDLQKKHNSLNQLLILKQQYIARNHIEEFEIDFALDFVPDWSKVDRWSSTARQGIEIRRQKWEHIFQKHSDVPLVKTLASELAQSGVNQSTFCREIAEAYFILSHNSYIYNRGPIPNDKGHKISELVHHPVMDKSLKIFMHTLPDSDFKFNETEELVKIPKSLYHKLLRKDAQMSLLRKHHEAEAGRKKVIHDSEEVLKDIHYHSETTSHHSDTPDTTPIETTTEPVTTTDENDSVLNSSKSSDKDSSDSSDNDSDNYDESDSDSDWKWSNSS